VIGPIDGHDVAAVDGAIAHARRVAGEDKPSLIMAKTVIGKGAPHRQGTEKAHGEALGEARSRPRAPRSGGRIHRFRFPKKSWLPGTHARWAANGRTNGGAHLRATHSSIRSRRLNSNAVCAASCRAAGWTRSKQRSPPRVRRRDGRHRKASQLALEALTAAVPELLGGSADLTGSNLTKTSATAPLRTDGEFSLAVHQLRRARVRNERNRQRHRLARWLYPYVGTFLTFSDYSRNALRMAALMKLRVAFVFTHDSIGLGEDGPTHQSVEHAASLRLIPNMDVWRPADTVESIVAWRHAIERRDGPTSLLFSRQAVIYFKNANHDPAQIERGAYVLSEAAGGAGKARAVLIATGSEVPLAMQAQQTLAARGVAVRVVSMPSTTVFDRQQASYKSSVLPEKLPRVAIEAGVTDFWWKYVRASGAVLGVDRFGESAPAPAVYEYLGLTAAALVSTVDQVLSRRKKS